jgi:hypothetical protein
VPTGALGLARNDDWSYADLLWRWQESGDLRLAGWESMTLVGQLLLAWPVAQLFPRDVAALQWFTVVAGALGALAAYATLRHFLSTSRSLLATALTLLSPLYAPVAVSFMTDVPAFAVQAVCMWFGTRALDRERSRPAWFAAAMAVGLFGVTIREYAVVAPIAVLAVFGVRAWARRERRPLAAAALAAGLSALFLATFIPWRRGWEASLSLQPSAPDGVGDAASSFGRSITFTLVTLAFLALPAFVFVPLGELIRRMTSARWSLVATISASIVLLAGAVATWQWSPPLLGPYLDQRGALGNDILPGDRPLLLEGWLLFPLLVVTLAAAVLLVGILWLLAADTMDRGPTWRSRVSFLDARDLAWAFVVVTIISLTAAGSADLPIFDRYLLPAAPFAAGLVLAWRPDAVSLGAHTLAAGARWLAVGVFVALGVVWSVDAARFDATRWAAGERAVALGYPAARVDAGFEWRNVHRPDGSAPMSPSQPIEDPCVRLTASGADLGPGWVPLFTLDHWHGTAGEDPLTAWATAAPGCPALP